MNRTYRNKSLRKGGGGRFARLEDVFREKGIDNPGALAASIGRAKYGKQEFQHMSEVGRHRRIMEEKNK